MSSDSSSTGGSGLVTGTATILFNAAHCPKHSFCRLMLNMLCALAQECPGWDSCHTIPVAVWFGLVWLIVYSKVERVWGDKVDHMESALFDVREKRGNRHGMALVQEVSS